MVDQVWAEQWGSEGGWVEVLEGRLLFCQRAGDTVASGSRVMGLRQPPALKKPEAGENTARRRQSVTHVHNVHLSTA